MKRLFKRSLTLLIFVFAVCLCANAGNGKVISQDKLPAMAKQTIKKSFTHKKVALVKMESSLTGKSYDVIFTDGDKIEFDRNGYWTEIVCNSSQVPTQLVPSAIRNYVKKNYHSVKIKEIEKDRSEYEVKLSNRLEITFDKNFNVIDIDD